MEAAAADAPEMTSRQKKDAEKLARKLAKAAKKAAEKAAAGGGGAEGGGAAAAPAPPADTGADISSIVRGDAGALTDEQRRVAAARAVTGVLASEPECRDVKFDAFTVMVGGNLLLTESKVELTQGRRYGVIGANGSGKSNVLAALAQREVPMPDFVDIFHLHEEAAATEQTGVEAVIAHLVDEAAKLEALSETIIEAEGPDDPRLEAIFERLDELDPTGSEPRARKILSGLGFADHLVPMDRKTKHMSGGWRMRVSLAKALFAAPSLLLLDEPTNHLDLEACVWLEEHLAGYSKCLVVVSHSEDFLNSVCSDMVWLKPNPFGAGGQGCNGCTLRYYGGNYDTFTKIVGEEERVQQKAYEKQQADMQKLSDFVRINRANGKADAAKSKKKVLEKVEAGKVERPQPREPSLVFNFPESEQLPPPVLPFDNVSFSYSGKPEDYLYDKLSLAVDYDSRVALVGPNGCGKSTLVKLMSGEIEPTRGSVKPHAKLRLTKYHQHSCDVLDLDKSPLEFMRSKFPAKDVAKEYVCKGTELCYRPRNEEQWRSFLTNFGFNTRTQTSPIGMLSDGQRSRLVFSMLAMAPAGVLLLDEPTNHLDLDAVECLAKAIKEFQGGVVLVSHDFRLIDEVAKEIWVCEDKSVKRFEGSIHDYKRILSKKMALHKV